MLRTRRRNSRVSFLVTIGLGGALVVGCAGCSDHDRRLTEGETLAYKRELLRENPQAISADQASDFGHDRGRTKGEIDARFDVLRREFDVDKAEARKEWEAERERARSELNDGGAGR